MPETGNGRRTRTLRDGSGRAETVARTENADRRHRTERAAHMGQYGSARQKSYGLDTHGTRERRPARVRLSRLHRGRRSTGSSVVVGGVAVVATVMTVAVARECCSTAYPRARHGRNPVRDNIVTVCESPGTTPRWYTPCMCSLVAEVV